MIPPVTFVPSAASPLRRVRFGEEAEASGVGKPHSHVHRGYENWLYSLRDYATAGGRRLMPHEDALNLQWAWADPADNAGEDPLADFQEITLADTESLKINRVQQKKMFQRLKKRLDPAAFYAFQKLAFMKIILQEMLFQQSEEGDGLERFEKSQIEPMFHQLESKLARVKLPPGGQKFTLDAIKPLLDTVVQYQQQYLPAPEYERIGKQANTWFPLFLIFQESPGVNSFQAESMLFLDAINVFIAGGQVPKTYEEDLYQCFLRRMNPTVLNERLRKHRAWVDAHPWI